MLRRFVVVAPVALFGAACSVFFDLSSLSGADAGAESTDDASPAAESSVDSPAIPESSADSPAIPESSADSVAPPESGGVDVAETGAEAGEASAPPPDAAPEASTCACSGIVSAYRFEDPKNLGHDAMGNNDFSTVNGAPVQSTVTPAGFAGHSMQLDGSSSVCMESGFTFDSTSDHSLCWWSRPAALANSTDQFAQTCSYDAWTANGGADYLWRINNCNAGTAANFQVPNVYTLNKWVQICQTYTSASKTRTVVIDGDINGKYKQVDTVPIVEDPAEAWCIGSFDGGGYWTGSIYLPIWFDHALSDAEIQMVNATGCCLP